MWSGLHAAAEPCKLGPAAVFSCEVCRCTLEVTLIRALGQTESSQGDDVGQQEVGAACLCCLLG